MTNVLVLSPFFFPEPISTGKYNTIIAKEISEKVESVDVFCSHPIYPSWKVEVTSNQLKGVTAIRGGKWLKFPSHALLRRGVLEIWFLFYVFYKLLLTRKKYSHIVAIFPPSLFMLVVPMLSRKSRIIGIVHDLQGVYAKNNSGFIKGLIFSAIKKVESRAFSCCKTLIFLSSDMKEEAEREYQLGSVKNVVHYPFITIDQFRDNAALKNILPDNKLSLVYSGALGEKQAPELLIALMNAIVQNNPEINAHIFSQGPIFEGLKQGNSQINFHGLVDEADLPELLLRSSIQILPQAMGTSDGSLPSKLPNILASNCKILCITDDGSELVKILKNYSLSEVATSWDIENLLKLVEKLLIQKSVEKTDDKLLDMFRKESLVDTILGGSL